MVYKLSDLDKEILKGLKKNSRIAFTKLAEEIGIPDTTLNYHVKNMKKNNIIKKFTIVIGNLEEIITIFIKLKIGGHIIPEASTTKARTLGKKLSTKFNFIAISEDNVTLYGIISLKNEEELNYLISDLNRDPDIIRIDYNKLDVIKGESFLTLESF